MSAYLCDSETFNAIATYAGKLLTNSQLLGSGLDDPSFTAIRRALITENLRSLNYRYPSMVKDHAANVAKLLKQPFKALEVDKGTLCRAIGEYNYQSCEHPTFNDSPAAKVCQAVMAAIENPETVKRWNNPADYSPTPTPTVDPLVEARASLSRSLALSADSPADNVEGLTILLTLALISADRPEGRKFADLASKLETTELQRRDAQSKAAIYCDSLRSILSRYGG